MLWLRPWPRSVLGGGVISGVLVSRFGDLGYFASSHGGGGPYGEA